MNFSLMQWGMWLLRHQVVLPEVMRHAEIAFDKSGKYSFAQQVDAVIAILQIVKTIEADAPVHLFGAGPDDDAEPTEVAAFEAEAEQYGISVSALIAVASFLWKLFGRKA